MSPTVTADYDVIVVGTGVAGLSTALTLAGIRRTLVISATALAPALSIAMQSELLLRMPRLSSPT